MAEVQQLIGASPEHVFAVLSDAYSYDRWVVGAKGIRSADHSWPQPGSLLHHKVGFGPFTLADNTKVLECEPPHRLLLEGRARPVGVVHIVFAIAGEGSGSRVSLSEWAVRPKVVAMLNPVLDPLVRARNQETLRRLADIVAGRFSSPRP